ncbi:uncharacterized protein LOC143018604 isoform X2 [Oratosquilla oratoria]|uniref:uncharacterized protein LOC143018604 isoform X2 n=1 Tax=Oratosquilla oratoria TaxID=337810 RepID=UPI003F75CF2A
MAVFLVNNCKFSGCGLSFPNLLELIQHIEETHIDPKAEAAQEAQQPSCLPLSSVLRFFSPGVPRLVGRKHLLSSKGSGQHTKVPKLSQSSSTHGKFGSKDQSTTTSVTFSGNQMQHSSLITIGGKSTLGGSSGSVGSTCSGSTGTPSSTRESTPVSALSNSPPVSDAEDMAVSDNEDSNDSWTTQEEIPAELIIKLASKVQNSGSSEEKPYVCPVFGCRKRYKNVNGIKYHAKNAHKKDSKVRKPFRCYCGKSYCTNQGLKNHCTHTHQKETMTTVTTTVGEVLQVPANQLNLAQVTTNQTSSPPPPTTTSAVSSLISGIQAAPVATNSITNQNKVTSIVTTTETLGTNPGSLNAPSSNSSNTNGHFVKGGTVVSKNNGTTTTTISSINLSELIGVGGGKIALKALPNGQLLLSQPIEGKVTARLKPENGQDTATEESKTGILQLRADGVHQLELSKLLQLQNKPSQSLAVTSSTISVALPATSLNTMKSIHKNTSSLITRTVRNKIGQVKSPASLPALINSSPVKATTATSIVTPSIGQGNCGSIGQGGDGLLPGQGVLLGVTMEEGTLVDTGDGTLSELTVIE